MTLTEALQLLKEDRTDEFMAAVRPLAAAVLTEKPWKHEWQRDEGTSVWTCHKCIDYPGVVLMLTGGAPPVDGCPVPPLLEGSAADIAFRLRDFVVCRTNEDVWGGVKAKVWDAVGLTDVTRVGTCTEWYSDFATPYEQIAVCCEALNLFDDKERRHNG
jgi:hypothetical protein